MTNNQSIFISIIVMVIIVTSGAAREDLELFLLIGQSNMAGRAAMDEKINQDTAPIPNTWLFKDSAEWIPAKNPLNWYSTHRLKANLQRIGPGYGFALRVREIMPDIQIGLVVQAVGGTSINLWKRGGDFYDNAVNKTLQAMKSGTLRAILWHQGEYDNGSVDTYIERVTTLITSLREDLGIDALPFIAGQLVNVSDKFARFNTMITGLPEAVPNTGVVLTDNTMRAFDGVHFNREAQIELGSRYAGKMFSMVDFNEKPAGTSFLFPAGNFGTYPGLGNSSWPIILSEYNGELYNILGRLRIK